MHNVHCGTEDFVMYFPSGKGAREQLWNADNDIKGILKYTASVYLEPTHVCSCFNNLWTAQQSK